MEFTSEAAMAATCLIHSQHQKSITIIKAFEEDPAARPVEQPTEVEFEPLRIPSWLARPIISIGLWVQHHLRLMCSGDTPHVRVGFSFVVAASSFLYLAVAYAYWLHGCTVMVLMFVGVTITSLFSDSINPGSKTWCCLDRSLATFGVFVGPVRAIVYFADGVVEQLIIIGLSLFSILFLAWSRTSKNQSQFVLRHTCWHAVSSACLLWLAFNCPPVAAQPSLSYS